MADEGLHEFHLSAKHLVSLFMTAAVVLVVTFLCGVLVGRGVRAQKEPTAAAVALTPGASAAADPTASVTALQPGAKTTPEAQQAAPAPPAPPEEDLSYYSRLEGKSAPSESAKAAVPSPKPIETAKRVETAAKRVETAAKPAERPKRVEAPTPASRAASAEPAGSGYVVKIVAYRDKAQADALASRLSGKGYAAFVALVSGKGAPLYSVRVGKFKTRVDAESASRRLEKEEQFKPLITR